MKRLTRAFLMLEAFESSSKMKLMLRVPMHSATKTLTVKVEFFPLDPWYCEQTNPPNMSIDIAAKRGSMTPTNAWSIGGPKV